MQTSVTLLESLQKTNSPAGWSRFVRSYSPIVYRWARQLNTRPEDAEDLVQKVFLQVFRKIPDFNYDPGKSFRGWLKCLLRNLDVDIKRKKSLHPINNYNMDFLPGQVTEDYFTTSYQRDLLMQGVEGIRGDFTQSTFEAFYQTAIQGQSIPEVAVLLGIPNRIVHQARARVLKRLRDYIGGIRE